MASRKEEKERRRQERLAAERAAAEQAQRRRTYGIFAGGVLVVAAIVSVVVIVAAGGGGGGGGDTSPGNYSKKAENTLPPPTEKIKDLFQAAKAAHCDLQNPPIQGRNHVTGNVKYATNPPTSGNHNPVPTPDGVYKKEPGPTHFVHTLEHGRVELQYSPSLSEKRIQQLGGLFNEDPHLMLMFPNKTMKYKIAVATWGHLIGCKKVTNVTFDAIRAFRDRYRDTAPEPSITQTANF